MFMPATCSRRRRGVEALKSMLGTSYIGSRPEITVATNPNRTMKIKNFQMVFHHCPKEIFATARPATVMPATG